MPRPARRSGNLPADATSFIGGRRELAELRRKLASARLVSLVGPGGVGKTRLAIRIATGSHVDIAGCILSAAKQETARCDPHTWSQRYRRWAEHGHKPGFCISDFALPILNTKRPLTTHPDRERLRTGCVLGTHRLLCPWGTRLSLGGSGLRLDA